MININMMSMMKKDPVAAFQDSVETVRNDTNNEDYKDYHNYQDLMGL